ncbi:MAG: hypothetical protein WCF23_18845 [Candidatus Nitrosopolaris sp.]
MTSQAGGLHTVFQIPNNKQNVLPDESVGYLNIIHAQAFIRPHDQNLVHAELNSTQVQIDVSKLLNSEDDKFADSIGIGAPYNIPNNIMDIE